MRQGRSNTKVFLWCVTLSLKQAPPLRSLLLRANTFSCLVVDGYLHPVDTDLPEPSSDSSQRPPTPAQTMQKIPKRVIQNAAGIAVFTCMRSGLWMTGSGGSGILIARKSDGTWSPPSGIMLHTPTLSFIIGVDIYDCVLVVSNLTALETITRSRVTLGEDVSLVNGPSVPLESEEKRISWKDLDNTVLAYMKARGQHQSVNLNGCILTERANENERFYNSDVTQMDVLAGNVSRHVEETKPLFEVIKMAEGRTDFDRAVIDKTAVQPAPGDAVIETPRSTTPASPRFGVPKADDPDPFGILALEMAGLEIREAGSRLRPTSSQVDFGNRPMSPALSKFSRQSIESMARSNRGSYMSTRTVKSQVTDVATQTNTRSSSPSPRESSERSERPSLEKDDVDYTAVDMSSLRHISQEYAKTPVIAEEPEETEPTEEDAKSAKSTKSRASSPDEEQDEFDDDNDDDDEEPVVFEVAAVQPARTQAVASRMIQARGNVVTIAKRVPPPLPRRSPARVSRLMKSEGGDTLGVKSPLRQAFSEADLRDEAANDNADAASDEIKSTGDIDESRMSRISDMGQVLHSNRASAVSIKADAPKEEVLAVTAPAVETAVIETEPKHLAVANNSNIADDSEFGDDSEVADDSESGFIDAVTAAPLHVDKRISLAESEPAEEEAPVVTAPIVSVKGAAPVPALYLAAKDAEKETPIIREVAPTVDVTEDSDDAMDGDDEDISDISDSELMDAEFSIMEPATIRTMRLSQVSNGDSKLHKLEFRKSHEVVPVEDKAPVTSSSFVDDELSATMMAFDNLAQIDDSDSHPSTPHNEHTDASDSASIKKKHSSSIYTGATDDRWSYDGSSPTTPTSDRPSSMSGDLTDEGTPKKHKRKTQELDSVDHIEPLEPVDSHNGDTTPTAVTVA
ncbi:hypothetical protein NLG97_g10167 [Lecanicillium saksenae]|uniref:Uncharacterized protein n=1 Tax=Lecanicillium saksenae TaxID=468837 RepID=A0ACC1QGF9_9HYPO|nr:hypothetical protein NLG97_g10167 [Lecanicillium saksenae]